MAEKMTVDELLTEQSKHTFKATIENIEDTKDMVKITPWKPQGGCHCHLALNVAKSAIEGVTPTSETHVCCGKSLKVVEVHFKEGQQIDLQSVFNQLNAPKKHEHGEQRAQKADLAAVLRQLASPNYSHHDEMPLAFNRRRPKRDFRRPVLGSSPIPWGPPDCESRAVSCKYHCENSEFRGMCTCLCDLIYVCPGDEGIPDTCMDWLGGFFS